MSGSLAIWFGAWWCLLCLLFHQARLIPLNKRAEHQAGAVICLAGDEDLPVRGVVAEEPEMREDQAEQRRPV